MNIGSSESGRFSRTKPVVLLTGLVMVVLGIAVLVNPIGAMEALVRLVGWILVAFGGITVASAVMRGDPLKNAPADLALGGVAVVLGLVMGISPGALVKFVWTIIGVLVFITGILDIMEAGSFRRTGSPLAMPATVSGFITVILGVIVIIAPMFSLAIGMLFAAVALIVDGITEIIFGLSM